MRKSLLFTGAIVAAVVLSGVKVYADSAQDIEQYYSLSNQVSWDTTDGQPVITAIASQPGPVGGHNYTAYLILAQDSDGSLGLNIYTNDLAAIGAGGYGNSGSAKPTVGDYIGAAGMWNPYHQISELSFGSSTAEKAHSNSPTTPNSLTLVSSGHVAPAATVITVASGDVATLPLSIAGYYVEIQNVTISGGGAYSSTLPTYANGNVTYTITDSTGSMTLYDWVTSYSTDAAMGGTAVPTGAVNVYGLISVYGFGATASPEFIPLSIVPEPSTVMLVGLGLVGLLGFRRRRS